MREVERLRFDLHSRLPVYQRHVRSAQKMVADALTQMNHPYIAFSTGKDSLCVADLIWSRSPDVPGVYFDADCAFPESTELLERYAKQHTIIKWKCEPMLETFARLGGPTVPGIGRATMESTVYTPVRSLLETYGFDGVFLGLRSEESEGRKKTGQVHGPLYRYKRDDVLRCLPVLNFTFSDVWAYIVSNDLDYNRVYDRMWDMPEEDRRVSYWAGETKVRWGRWVWLRLNYPELFNRFAARFPEVREYC